MNVFAGQVTWLVYGIYLHLRITLVGGGGKLAWYALIALMAMIVSTGAYPFRLRLPIVVSGLTIIEGGNLSIILVSESSK